VTIASQATTEFFSPNAVREATFRQTRHGFDQKEVRGLLDRVAGQLQAAESERAQLRAQVSMLRDELRNVGESAARSSDETVDISVQAVNLLSQAQLAADSCVAEAEQYARDLVVTARDQYREILQRAQQTASNTVRDLPVASAAATSGYTEPLAEVEYVRTFARVAQVQLRSVLDALTAEVDKLGQIPQLQDASGSEETVAEVTWLPNVPPPIESY
jgi:cell division initiation protein